MTTLLFMTDVNCGVWFTASRAAGEQYAAPASWASLMVPWCQLCQLTVLIWERLTAVSSEYSTLFGLITWLQPGPHIADRKKSSEARDPCDDQAHQGTKEKQTRGQSHASEFGEVHISTYFNLWPPNPCWHAFRILWHPCGIGNCCMRDTGSLSKVNGCCRNKASEMCIAFTVFTFARSFACDADSFNHSITISIWCACFFRNVFHTYSNVSHIAPCVYSLVQWFELNILHFCK